MALAAIYWASLNAVELGSARVKVQSTARETLRRLMPLLQTGTSLVSPSPGAIEPELSFYSCDELITSQRPPDAPRNPVYLRYRLLLLNGDLVLERVTSPASSRIVARHLTSVWFEVLDRRTVCVTVEARVKARTATHQEQEKVEKYATVLDLPFAAP